MCAPKLIARRTRQRSVMKCRRGVLQDLSHGTRRYTRPCLATQQRGLSIMGDFTVRIFDCLVVLRPVHRLRCSAGPQRQRSGSQAGSRRLLQPSACKRLDAGMKAIVDNKQLAGIATMVARHGQIVQQMAYGQQDIASNTPHAEGHDRPHLFDDQADHRRRDDDPVRGRQVETDRSDRRYIPEFKDLKVFKSLDADGKPVARRAEPCADDGRADVAHRRLHLRVLRQHAGRQDVSAGEPARARLR